MSDRETLPYGAWRSPITSDLIVGETIGLGDILVDGARHLLDRGPAQRRRPQCAGAPRVPRRGSIEDITPAPFSARTRVHEYGGGAATVHRGFVYFSNFADQRLYQQAGGSAPTPLTPPPDPERGGIRWRYADGLIDDRRKRWIGVREEHAERPGRQHAGRGRSRRSPARAWCWRRAPIFMPRPRCRRTADGSPGCNWDHPNMPWVGTELWLADIGADGQPRRTRGASRAATASRSFSRNGRPTACCISSPTAAAGGICTAATRTAAARCTRSARAMPNSARRNGFRPIDLRLSVGRRSSSAPIPRPGMTGSPGSTSPPAS